jgi:hypothetical protein
MKVLPNMVFPALTPTISRIELRDKGYVIFECGVATGNCITEFGPFDTYREAIGYLRKFPLIKPDPYLKWKQEHPRHAWAMEHLEGFESYVEFLFKGFEFHDEFVKNLWEVAHQLEEHLRELDESG